MRIAPMSLARPLGAACLLATAAAVLLARAVPQPSSTRRPSPASHVQVGPIGSEDLRGGSLWLDAETGRTLVVPTPTGEVLDRASRSPWLDRDGRAQLVGRISRAPGDPASDFVGIVRMSFPDGRVLDRVGLESLPTSPPCWYPGTSARVLFAAGDSRLHVLDFESEGAFAGPRPSPLAWAVPTPAFPAPRLATPCWPADPRFRRTILVGLEALADPPCTRAGPRLIWWLRLDESGRTIEDAGPVFDPGTLPEEVEASTPSVVARPGGGLGLAYYTSDHPGGWTLRLAPLAFDADGRPHAAGGPGEALAEGCYVCVPATASEDGRWLSVVRVDGAWRGTTLRLDLADRPDVAPPAPASVDPTPRPGRWSILVALVQALLVFFEAVGDMGKP